MNENNLIENHLIKVVFLAEDLFFRFLAKVFRIVMKMGQLYQSNELIGTRQNNKQLAPSADETRIRYLMSELFLIGWREESSL